LSTPCRVPKLQGPAKQTFSSPFCHPPSFAATHINANMSLLYNTYINTVEFVKGCFSAIDHDSFLKIMDYVGTDIESRFLERCAMKHCGCSV
jgi:hypothetical protein